MLWLLDVPRLLAAFAIGCRGQMPIARDRCGAPRVFIRPARAAEPRIAAAETAVRYRYGTLYLGVRGSGSRFIIHWLVKAAQKR